MFIHVILDVHSHLYSILESRISSKTPWRMLWRLKWEWRMSSSSAPIGLKFCTELPWYLYIIPDNQSHQYFNQVSRISSKTAWRKHWILIGECPLAVSLEVWYCQNPTLTQLNSTQLNSKQLYITRVEVRQSSHETHNPPHTQTFHARKLWYSLDQPD